MTTIVRDCRDDGQDDLEDRVGRPRLADHIPHIGHLLDTGRLEVAKPLKLLALPSGIEPLSPP